MSEQSKNWITNPSKKTLILVSAIWMISNTLLILAATNLFQEKLTLPIPVKGLIGGSTSMVFGLFVAYYKNKESDSSKEN